MKQVITKLSSIFNKKDKSFFLILVFSSIIVSVVEIIGISAIMPFLSMSIDFNYILENKYTSYIYNFVGFDNQIDFIFFFGVILFLFYIFRSFINIFYVYLMARFSQGRYHIIAYRLFESYMGMPYKEFVNKNSSYLTKSIVSEAKNLASLISAILTLISELFVAMFIYVMLIFVNYKVTLLLTIFLLINTILILKTVSIKIKAHGEQRAEVQKFFYEIINKSFGNFKLLKLQSDDRTLLKEFNDSSYKYFKVNTKAQTIMQVPKYILEAISFCLIILIVLFLVWEYKTNIAGFIGVLSMFVLSLYRLMPSVNRIMSSYNQILFTSKSLEIIHSDLVYDYESLGDEKVVFNKEIILENISFSYNQSKMVLNNTNLKIKKGKKIAFIGESGSGKSTLVDLIIGLYKPIDGNIYVDNSLLSDKNIKNWRTKIGYIPQSVYLFDGTVGDNIVCGSVYDEKKIIKCLKHAEIFDFLEKKDGINTFVGEGGIMLSGGQKQRIAIARALYNEPEILVLDEATSALDTQTEEKIMDEIYKISEGKTLLIIAHRLSTIKGCDFIYKVTNGVLVEERPFKTDQAEVIYAI